ncbi:hypothetical protein [Paraherbaspirillum soli]|uniref:Histidine kinase n=1 Tax=Paraherbaspirillum soli TaxID=631222 RepID=A0ABW0MAW4_9BURK
MKKTIAAFGLIAAWFAAGAAHASDVGITADLGTTGMGFHVTVPVQSSLNARFGLNYLSYSYDGSTSDLDYKFKLNLNTFDALLDWFPMDNGFRISSGLVYNNNKITANAKPNQIGTYTINGNTYSAANAGQVDGKIDFRKIAPYVGIGWGNAVAKDKGWGFSSDLGVLFQGGARTSLNNSGCTADAATCARLASDVNAENVTLQDKVHNYKAYPVLRVGVSYRF